MELTFFVLTAPQSAGITEFADCLAGDVSGSQPRVALITSFPRALSSSNDMVMSEEKGANAR